MNITDKNNADRNEIFKNRVVQDYFGYVEGDYEVSLGKVIKTLITASESYIVYLDNEDFVEWTFNDKYSGAINFNEKYGSIINRIGFLEEVSNGVLKGNQKSAFRRLLGESMARILKEENEKDASNILDTAEQLLNSKSRQTLIITAFFTVAIISIIETFLWVIYNNPKQDLWIKHTIAFLFCSLSGGIGGFVFLMIRSRKLEFESAFNMSAYRWEGFLRIAYGVISGLLVYLIINSKILLGKIENPRFSFVTFLMCIVGGASEIIVPSIIKKIEGKF